MTKEKKRALLVEALRNIPDCMQTTLKALKKGSKDIARPDFVWHFMLQSLATQGNSRGSDGIIKDRHNYSKITFKALSKLDTKERSNTLRKVMRAAKVRMPDKKAEWAVTNFDIVARMGGMEKAKQLALDQKGKEAKIKFIKQFAGIGDKYARNFWMDVYHPEFRDCVAIDDRIKKITKAMGYSFYSYKEHERFYLEIASQAGLKGWELDRLLYNYRDHFLDRISRRLSAAKGAYHGLHTDRRKTNGCGHK
jgi:thermostable 8-oxoguanine DNA glycosylase